jgi:predicted aspartyl protease
MRIRFHLAPFAALLLVIPQAFAAEFGTRIPMLEKAAQTFYVPAYIEGFGNTELMVDTGSGYVTINEETLAAVKRQGTARYVKDLQGLLADGSELIVSVYAIKALKIGGNCWLHDVEAAVFPGKSRQILGLSALRKAAPFIFSVDPPSLALSHCGVPPVATPAKPVGEALTAVD